MQHRSLHFWAQTKPIQTLTMQQARNSSRQLKSSDCSSTNRSSPQPKPLRINHGPLTIASETSRCLTRLTQAIWLRARKSAATLPKTQVAPTPLQTLLLAAPQQRRNEAVITTTQLRERVRTLKSVRNKCLKTGIHLRRCCRSLPWTHQTTRVETCSCKTARTLSRAKKARSITTVNLTWPLCKAAKTPLIQDIRTKITVGTSTSRTWPMKASIEGSESKMLTHRIRITMWEHRARTIRPRTARSLASSRNSHQTGCTQVHDYLSH